ncbi:hypothetical protein BGX28_000538 [Mortierella sp. GBA30]|nr:hypothetical protein BGX28_000538 [Mortierella sp. GBA30]
MNPEPYLETPHFRHPSGGTHSSEDYETGAQSSASSMDNHATYRKHPSSKYPQKQPQPLLLQSLVNSKQQSLSAFATPPQSSPQSIRDGNSFHRNGGGSGGGMSSYHYSSESEEDPNFSSEPALLGDLNSTSSAHRTRRDSGLPPIKMAAAKRLPPFNTSLSSIPAQSLMEEDEEEDEEDEDRQTGNRRLDHTDEDNVDEALQEDQEQDEMVQIRDRDMDARHVNNLSRTLENGGSKPSHASQQSAFHPFPSPPARSTPKLCSTALGKESTSLSSTSSSSTANNQGKQLKNNGYTPSVSKPVEPDRGPADLSNPSMALAEALIAARSKAESKSAERNQSSVANSPTQSRTQSQAYAYANSGGKQGPATAQEPSGPTSASQIRIPMPELSPSLRGYPSHHAKQQEAGRNPDGLLYNRRTSFTLSPTSSNPELAESQTDSHSDSYGTPRPIIPAGQNLHSVPTSVKYSNGATSRARRPSISSNVSRFSDDYNQERPLHHSRHHREPSILGTSYDSANSLQRQDSHMYSRFGFAGQDLDQNSLPNHGYDHHASAYRHGQSVESSSFPRDYTGHHQFGSSIESDAHPYTDKHGKAPKTSFQKNHPHERHKNSRSEPSGSASAYPHTASSHSFGISEDLQDQMNTEAEYIMSRNTELLRILSIRDEEIQTLQQELDHTLKVMHEYEDDLMAMHTAAAKPYESYHQTLDQIGHEMTQQDALLQGYQQENEKLTSQLKSSVEIRQEAEKRHLQTVNRLKKELSQVRAELESSDQEKYGTTDLRLQLEHSREAHEQARRGFKDKEDEYQAEISELKERLRMTEQALDEEKKNKAEDMQKLERDIQGFRVGYDNMLAQLKSLGPNYPTPHQKRGSSSSSSSSVDDGQADTTVDIELERDIGLSRASLMSGSSKSSTTTSSTTPSPPLSDKLEKQDLHKGLQIKALDQKLTSTESLMTASIPSSMDSEKMDLEQRISKFEADVRQSLLRTESLESIISVRSSTGTVIPLASKVKPHRDEQGAPRDDLRLSTLSEGHKLANKLRDRINTLNTENKRLHTELSTLSHTLRQQQAERQRKVAQLEELLDMHENVANTKLEASDTDEGQMRIRKVIQGLLVRIRTKEAEAEFYHNAYLDKVMELDQMALANGKALVMERPLEESQSQTVVDGLAVASPTGSVIEALEARIKELERVNMETAFRLAAEQRRAQAAETENATLVREKLTLARMLEDQVEQLQSKLSAAEIAKARLQDENVGLRQQQEKQQQQGSKDQQQQQQQDSHGLNSQPDAKASDNVNSESMAIMRTRMLSLTRQRDQLREQLQEAFDIQLAMQDRSGGKAPEWTVDDYKRLEQALEERTAELSIWKERAIALEKVVERIRMIKDKPEPTGLTLERSSATDSESVVSASSGGGRQHHTLEELDQVVLRLERRLERRDQELQEVVLEAKRQADQRLEAWKSKWVQVVQRKNAEIHRFQVELESLMTAVNRDRARMAALMKK